MTYEEALIELGQRIRELRNKKGLTQQQMGEGPHGVPISTYQDVEAGKRNVTFQTIYNISMKLEKNVQDLFKF